MKLLPLIKRSTTGIADQAALTITTPFVTMLLFIFVGAFVTAGLGIFALQYQTRTSLHESFSQNYERFLAAKMSQLLGRYPDLSDWEKEGNQLSLQLRKMAPISGLSGIVISNTKNQIIGSVPAETACRARKSSGATEIKVNNVTMGYVTVCLETDNHSQWEIIDLLAVGSLTSRVGTDYSFIVASLFGNLIGELGEPEYWDLASDAISNAIDGLTPLKGISSVSVYNNQADFVATRALNEKDSKPVMTTTTNISYLGRNVGQVTIDIDFPEIREIQSLFRTYLLIGIAVATILLFAFPVIVVRRLDRTAQVSFRELRDSHSQLQTTQTQLVSSAKMAALGAMASGIAHEINNPLAIIIGNTDAIFIEARTGKLTIDSAIESADKISQTVQRISKIVKALRALAREGQSDPFVSTSLQSILSETLEICSERAKFLGIRLKVADIPVNTRIDCQAVSISQVILNLINNAYDAIEAQNEKWVSVDLKEEEAFVELAVTDSGSGITPAMRLTLFQPFVTTKAPGKGTGLGLSLSKQIVEGHGGQMTLDETSENTRFIVRLPKSQVGRSTGQTDFAS
jgi:signal transduction histidine kinase